MPWRWSVRPPAPSAVLSSARRGLALTFAAGLALLGCSGGSREIPAVPVGDEVAQYLPAPTESCGAVGADFAAQSSAHAVLLADRRTASSTESQALERPHWALLQAQARFVSGDLGGALEAADRAVGNWPACFPAWLLKARIHEIRGDLVPAVAAYRRAVGASDLAESALVTARLSELTPALAAALSTRIDEEIARGRLDLAELSWIELQRAGAAAEAVDRAEAAIAAAQGNPARELTAFRRLKPDAARDESAADRWALLELEQGDPAIGVRLLEELAGRHPGDSRWQRRLEQGKFRWRLTLLPPRVREVLRRQQLTRADLAVALYWVMPGVRHARSQAISIATDVVDHPSREEIVRVLNLGILEVDEALHNFWPTRPTNRGESMAATLRAAAVTSRASCGLAPGVDGGRDGTCRAAVSCGLIASLEECLASAPVSGADLVGWFSAFAGAGGEGGGP